MFEVAEAESRWPGVSLVRDAHDCIPLARFLSHGDIVVLLTPVVAPDQEQPASDTDPFEPFGRAIAARHPWIRHIPYTSHNGITSTHVGFIKRARVVIFVISHPPAPGASSQLDMADVARLVGDTRPQILVACRDVHHLGIVDEGFPTVVQLPGYRAADLQAAAAVMFGEAAPGKDACPQGLGPTPASWSWRPQLWEDDKHDIIPVHSLWKECLPAKFDLYPTKLRMLLQRPGYSKHFAVRLPQSGEMVGFCATYTTFADQTDERLTGSLAMLLVKPEFRHQGIGSSLHKHALEQMKRIRGVDRIQLGSTFPRLFYGPPTDFVSTHWFRKRGWEMDLVGPGRGQDACDLLLGIHDWPSAGLGAVSSGLAFRRAEFHEFPLISELVERESIYKDNMGWYDQYKNLALDGRVEDIVVGLEQSTIVATAIIYTPGDANPIARDLPWAGSIGSDVGGITCICIADDHPAVSNSKDTIMIRLLDACVAGLKEQGMCRVFLDGVKGGLDGYQELGFQKWATYHSLWQQV